VNIARVCRSRHTTKPQKRFFESHQQAAVQPADELQNRGRFRFEGGLRISLPAESMTATEIVAW
jgi:hypothetical protein